MTRCRSAIERCRPAIAINAIVKKEKETPETDFE